MAGTRLVDLVDFEVGAVPIDTTGAAVTGDYVSMKNYGHLTIIIMQGAWAGGSPAVTLKQATDVGNSASDEKALSFTKRWSKVGLTGTSLTETTVSSDTYNIGTTANTIHILEVDADDLDKANGFDCVRVGVATPGANADLIAVLYILSQPRFAGAGTNMPDPKAD